MLNTNFNFDSTISGIISWYKDRCGILLCPFFLLEGLTSVMESIDDGFPYQWLALICQNGAQNTLTQERLYRSINVVFIIILPQNIIFKNMPWWFGKHDTWNICCQEQSFVLWRNETNSAKEGKKGRWSIMFKIMSWCFGKNRTCSLI